MPQDKAKAKNVNIFVALVLGAVLVAGIVWMYVYSEQDPDVSVTNEGIRISALYGLKVSFSDITGIFVPGGWVGFAIYAIGVVILVVAGIRSNKDNPKAIPLIIIIALTWPVMIWFAKWKPKASGNPPGAAPKPVEFNYRDLAFKSAAGKTRAPDMSGYFSQGLDAGKNEPLAENVIITYRPTGISKTYTAGTLFPAGFADDWKAGYFRGGKN